MTKKSPKARLSGFGRLLTVELICHLCSFWIDCGMAALICIHQTLRIDGVDDLRAQLRYMLASRHALRGLTADNSPTLGFLLFFWIVVFFFISTACCDYAFHPVSKQNQKEVMGFVLTP